VTTAQSAPAGHHGQKLVLIIEDDREVRESLERCLGFEGYDVVSAVDGEAALAAVARSRPDAVLLDLQLPRMDGLEVCRQIRISGDGVPILMLTARDSTRDRVSGLDAGADDYLPKPFALEELLARLRALLRRSAATTATQETLVVDDLRLVLPSRELTRGGNGIELTRTEFELLELLMSHPRQVLTRAQILREVWGFDYDPGSNTLEVYIGYLRRKTEEHGGPRLIHTARGVGYVLRPATQVGAGG
jgi:two-component system, OmpR family, response regulator MprA